MKRKKYLMKFNRDEKGDERKKESDFILEELGIPSDLFYLIEIKIYNPNNVVLYIEGQELFDETLKTIRVRFTKAKVDIVLTEAFYEPCNEYYSNQPDVNKSFVEKAQYEMFKGFKKAGANPTINIMFARERSESVPSKIQRMYDGIEVSDLYGTKEDQEKARVQNEKIIETNYIDNYAIEKKMFLTKNKKIIELEKRLNDIADWYKIKEELEFENVK